MRFSSQVRAGLRAALALGLREGAGPVSVREMAADVGVSEHYLEQVMAQLRRAGVVQATRGASGGYELARAATDLRLVDVLRALDGLPEGGDPAAEADPMERVLAAHLARASAAMAAAAEVRLADLVQAVREAGSLMYYI
ncbi:MAG: Rrf2 family transcriptional regulator [Firmicutes bacterium]|nr:Rrf2 family transcriptional regulator [Bacillota bacterium]